MALVEFDGYSVSRNSITLRSSGTIFMSDAIVNRLQKNAEAVHLYIDDEKPKIGLKLVKEYDEGKKNCRKINKEKSGISFSILPVLRHYNVDLKKPYKNMEMEIQDNIIILDLEKIAAENAKFPF